MSNLEFFTELVIYKQEQSNNTLFYLSCNFGNLDIIKNSHFQFVIKGVKNNCLIIQTINYNLQEIHELKKILNNNGYNLNIMSLSSNRHLFTDIYNNRCLNLERNINDLTDERLLNCVKMSSHFGFNNINKKLNSIYNDRFTMKDDDDLANFMNSMVIDA